MADAQPASSPVGDDDVTQWMAQRYRDVQNLGGQAEAVGRTLWAQATRAGQNLLAPNPGDIAAIGARFLNSSNVFNESAGQRAASQFVPTPDTPTLAALRQQQAQFKQTQLDPLDRQNSWMAAIGLVPTALLGLDLPAAFAAADTAPAAARAMDFPELDSWLEQIEQKVGRQLTTGEKNRLRELARQKWAEANGVRASDLGAQVHHEDPLEWAHLNPNADPNRLSNLPALTPKGHGVANQAWAQFRQSLGNAQPTPAEVMAQKLRLNGQLEPYVVRPGLPRPAPKPPVGGQ